jgi:hypothetical protein
VGKKHTRGRKDEIALINLEYKSLWLSRIFLPLKKSKKTTLRITAHSYLNFNSFLGKNSTF